MARQSQNSKQREAADRSNSRDRANKLAERRSLRQTVGERKQIMPTPQRDGFYRYWMNDTGTRIEDAMKLGWKVVEDENATLGTEESFERNKTAVGYRMDVGNGVTAILMEIPYEDWEADMILRAQENMRVEEDIRSDLEKQFLKREFSINQGNN